MKCPNNMTNEQIVMFMKSNEWEGNEDNLIFYKKNKWYGIDCSRQVEFFDWKKGMTFKTCNDFEECKSLL